ncbi:class II fructose-bisphosphate aldolase family protein [Paenibacillus antri]|uniref:Class II fructose-bisphosphate aldolase family protein n=1 Tax=Paenibacillus antri TaxID=2582848 RepID=A0A5R9GDZ2_9BACL|nr:class II fructose-bisphosphate aldolase [Paenibacillus antri]TLS49595.1 class II fructose-bisphosphate aldolase family protein [Paenibacillus antri]
MLASMKEMVEEAAGRPRAVPAFNVFGYEDAIAVVRAAERLGAPVMLSTNVVALAHMPFAVLAPMLLTIAREASVPVCVHLDHGKDYATVERAIAFGYPSVMFDGSQLPLADNIAETKRIAALARARGVSFEAEIGSVGYSDPSLGLKHEYTDPDEAGRFVAETGVDAVAVSIGTVHRMESQGASIDYDRLAAIEARVGATPLVLHGSTGVKDEDLRRLVRHRFGKINIGTALRMAFGRTLREEMEARPSEFDRIKLFAKPMEAVTAEALRKFEILGWGKE